MTRTIRTAIVVILACLLLAFVANELAAQRPPGSKAIRARYLEFNSAHLNPEAAHQELSAFVATGSMAQTCLATFNETNFGGTPTLLFCAPREAFGQKGVYIHVFFTEPVTQDLILTATVYQEGAEKYEAPVLCLASDGC